MFLDNFKNRIIHRGLDYFYNDNVKEVKRIDYDVISGVVEGSEEYEVTIDINNPYKSSCSCPYGDLCKHMVALYFEAFPDVAEEYSYEEYDEDEWYEQDDEYDDYHYNFIPPINYDELLDNFINSLNAERCKELLKDKLNENKEVTFNKYLKQIIINNDTVDKLNEINYELLKIVNDDFFNYEYSLIDKENKKYLLNNLNNEDVRKYLNKLLMDIRIYAYNDNLYFINLVKKIFTKERIHKLINDLNGYLDLLKDMGVKSLPKSNVLISIYELDDNKDINRITDSMIRNIKYREYVKYIIDKYDDIDGLFETFTSKIKNVRYKDKISETYELFYLKTNNKKAKELANYYGFMNNYNLVDLDELVTYEDFMDVYYPKLINSNKEYIIKNVYTKLDKKKELYEYLVAKNDIRGLCFYASFLDEKYHDELLEIFKEKAYEKLEIANNRDEYKDVAYYVRAIKDLNDGNELVDNFIDELRNDDRYKRRSALFDEIQMMLRR